MNTPSENARNHTKGIVYAIAYPGPDKSPDKSEEQLVQMCFDELTEVGMLFPRGMRPCEKKTLIKNDAVKVTLYCEALNLYRFFYSVFAGGSSTTFASASFKVEES